MLLLEAWRKQCAHPRAESLAVEARGRLFVWCAAGNCCPGGGAAVKDGRFTRADQPGIAVESSPNDGLRSPRPGISCCAAGNPARGAERPVASCYAAWTTAERVLVDGGSPVKCTAIHRAREVRPNPPLLHCSSTAAQRPGTTQQTKSLSRTCTARAPVRGWERGPAQH